MNDFTMPVQTPAAQPAPIGANPAINNPLQATAGFNINNPYQMPQMNTGFTNTGLPQNGFFGGTPGSQIFNGLPVNMVPQFGPNQQVNDQTIKINPQVMTLVNPIIESMTQYEMFQKASPAFGMWDPKNSTDEFQKRKWEELKKNCVHLIRDIQTGQLIPTLEEVDDTKFVCRVCGRPVYKKFDDTASKKIEDAIAVLNQLVFFGMSLNLSAEQVSKIIFIKSTLPELNNLVGTLNKFVKEEDNMISSGANIGEASRNAEFRVGNMLGFNGF